MANKTRKTGKGLRLFRRVYSPISHALLAARNVSRSLFRGSEKIMNTGLNTVNKAGTSVTGHADEMIRDVVSRKNRKNRKNRKDRKDRKTRRNRK
jgi:hypothetical protein